MAAKSDPIVTYYSEIKKKLDSGHSTEHTHRAALQHLIEDLGGDKITAINEPKRIECGAPDYVIQEKKRHGAISIGYVEAKDIGVDLNKTLKTDQLKRYRKSLPNLILTDYIDFRWYVDGEHKLSARLDGGEGGQGVLDDGGADQVRQLLRAFLTHEFPGITSAKMLAQRMAQITHIIRDMIVETFANKAVSSALHDMRRAVEQALIPNLKDEEFGDMFAQTIAYGLFAARANHPSGAGRFRRLEAGSEIPKTNPLLRNLFKFISSHDLEEETYYRFVEDLTQLLADTDMDSVLTDFGKRTKQEDPVVHFYETFLAAYDPKLRESRGVYYTPDPVVSYIVRSVDFLLKDRFGCKDGLAETSKVEFTRTVGSGRKKQTVTETAPKVLVLDPACGTGTFLYHTVDHIRRRFMESGNAGAWPAYVSDHILPRIFGFELLMAPYAVAHLKLGLQLAGQDLPEKQREKWAYDFVKKERLGVYLTNTLEEAERRAQIEFGFLQTLSEESNEAARIKSELPIMVVMGNPPYSGVSANKGEWIGKLVRDYYQVNGKPLGERNPKWLQDDYVKFIRFGQWRIEQTGAGILAFITNHAFLDNPTFRGMRQQLLKAFSDLYILNLHGSSKKKERSPDGSLDQNVFDIQQGVSINIFVKDSGKATGRVHSLDLWGTRKHKYQWLQENSLESSHWDALKPQSPHYFLIPYDTRRLGEYEAGWKITDAMPTNSVGIATARDRLAIHWSEDELWQTVLEFSSLSVEDARNKFRLGDDVQDWKVSWAQRDIKTSGPQKSLCTRIMYRPFDQRFTYYTGKSRGFLCRPREKVMSHMLGHPNLGLVTSRLAKGEEFAHAQVTRDPTEVICMSPKTSNNGFLFPLYLYPASSGALPQGRGINLAPDFIAAIESAIGWDFTIDESTSSTKAFGPLDVFNYIYAIIHSPTYRKRYAEYLKVDFPRIPITSDKKIFTTLCKLGGELVALHLMDTFGPSIASFPESGSNEVEKVRYSAPGEGARKGRVWINKEQYFEGVPPEVWDFHIGGYQVCAKWLKDRKGRTLSFDDIQHYERVVSALAETIRLMDEIDKAIPEWPIK